MYWSSISAFRKKLKIISYFQRFLHNFFTFYPKNPKRPNRQSANMAHFVAFCIGFQKNIPLQNPPGGGGEGGYMAAQGLNAMQSCSQDMNFDYSWTYMYAWNILYSQWPAQAREMFKYHMLQLQLFRTAISYDVFCVAAIHDKFW